MVASDGYLIGFDIGGTRLKTGVVRVDGTVERATLEDTSRGGFGDVVLPLLRSHAREHIEATGTGCAATIFARPRGS